jgi:hypothetical protein
MTLSKGQFIQVKLTQISYIMTLSKGQFIQGSVNTGFTAHGTLYIIPVHSQEIQSKTSSVYIQLSSFQKFDLVNLIAKYR